MASLASPLSAADATRSADAPTAPRRSQPSSCPMDAAACGLQRGAAPAAWRMGHGAKRRRLPAASGQPMPLAVGGERGRRCRRRRERKAAGRRRGDTYSYEAWLGGAVVRGLELPRKEKVGQTGRGEGVFRGCVWESHFQPLKALWRWEKLGVSFNVACSTVSTTVPW